MTTPHEPQPELISEPISVTSFDTSAMKLRLAGAPTAFVWRGDPYTVDELLERRKFSQGDTHNPGRSMYLRREYFLVRLHDGSVAELYIERHARSGTSAKARKQRWFIYTILRPED